MEEVPVAVPVFPDIDPLEAELEPFRKLPCTVTVWPKILGACQCDHFVVLTFQHVLAIFGPDTTFNFLFPFILRIRHRALL